MHFKLFTILLFADVISTTSAATEHYSAQSLSTNTTSDESHITEETTNAKPFSSSSSFSKDPTTKAVITDALNTVYTATETVTAETPDMEIVSIETLLIENVSTAAGSAIHLTTEAQETLTYILDGSSTDILTTTDSFDQDITTKSIHSGNLGTKSGTTEIRNGEDFSTEIESRTDGVATTKVSNIFSTTSTLPKDTTTTLKILQEDTTTNIFSATENSITDDAFTHVASEGTSTKAPITKDLFTEHVTPSSMSVESVTSGDL